MKYNGFAVFSPGNKMHIADALSRSPISQSSTEDDIVSEEVELHVQAIEGNLPATKQKLEAIKEETKQAHMMQQLIWSLKHGWPERRPQEMQPYYEARDRLSYANGLIFYNDRILIPDNMRSDLLGKAHQGHLGISRTRSRAAEAIWWPGIGSDIEKFVTTCKTCARYRPAPIEPLIPTKPQERPWQTVGTDFMEYRGNQYLVVVDYYSKWIVVHIMGQSTGFSTVSLVKSMFARYGIPDTVRSDNGPHFSSRTFKEFVDEYGFKHKTSSPGYSQSNGGVERAIRTLKEMLNKSENPHKTIMAYRATPNELGYSPAQLFLARKIKTDLPISPQQLAPTWPD